MPLKLAAVDSTYFTRQGRRFVPIGAHWVPAKTGLGWPLHWDENDLQADFAKMAELGFNTVRLDLFWAWFEPRPGVYNPEAFRQLDVFIRLAHQYEIYLHPALFIGGEVGEAFWDVPWRQGRHPHADPELLRLQTDHAAELARRYAAEPAILAWDLTDEPPYWIVGGQTTDAMAINWTRLLAGAVRRVDPGRPLCVGTSMEDVHHGPFRPDNLVGEVEFTSVHPYSIYTLDRFPDPMLSQRGTYAGAFQVALSLGVGKPVMIHEFGASSAQYSPERIALYDRSTLYSGLAAGACGFLAWCFTDAAPELYRQAPYLRAPHETQFGLTTWERQDRPRGRVLRDFSRVLAHMDLTGLQPAPGEAALLVPHEWAKPHGDQSRFGLSTSGALTYTSVQDNWDSGDANLWLTRTLLSAFIFARRAGLKVDFPREYSSWQQHLMLLLPSPLTSTERNLAHIHTATWDAVREYVRAGGLLYASLCADAAIPNMEALFGARLADHAPVGEVVITFTSAFGEIKLGTLLRFQANASNPKHWPAVLEMAGGQVLAVDQENRPALVAHVCGRGTTLLSAYPLETYLAELPVAFERPEGTHALLRGLALIGGITPLFSTDTPDVEVAGLVGQERGYAILASHQPEAQRVTVTSRHLLQAVRLLEPGGARPLPLEGSQWQLDIEGYGGAVVEYIKD